MEEIGYRAWSLIPSDPDPATGSPSFFRPPMLTAAAMDQGASLVFHLRRVPGRLQISLEATALSSEGRTDQLFKLFTSSTGDAFRPIPCPGWTRSVEGMYTSFSTQADAVKSFLKILFDEPVPIVINQVYFKRP